MCDCLTFIIIKHQFMLVKFLDLLMSYFTSDHVLISVFYTLTHRVSVVQCIKTRPGPTLTDCFSSFCSSAELIYCQELSLLSEMNYTKWTFSSFVFIQLTVKTCTHTVNHCLNLNFFVVDVELKSCYILFYQNSSRWKLFKQLILFCLYKMLKLFHIIRTHFL